MPKNEYHLSLFWTVKVLGCQRVQGLAQVSFNLADELGVTEMGWAVKFYAEFDELFQRNNLHAQMAGKPFCS